MRDQRNEEEAFLNEEQRQASRTLILQSASTKEKVSWSSLPNKTQLLILAACRLSEPLSNSTLLAYVYFLLQHVLSSPSTLPSDPEIARQSGLLVGVFPLAQFATSLLWGWLSDRHGRKPIIIFGLVVSVIANLCFGFSTSFRALMFWRALAGLANGNTSVMRTMTAEIVVLRKYRARAFLLLPLIFNTGRIAALALGGCLADPIRHLPWLFGKDGFFNSGADPEGVSWAQRYPFALPVIVNSMFLFSVLVVATFGMKETAPLVENKGYREKFTKVSEFIRRYIRTKLRSSSGYTAIKLDEENVELPEGKPGMAIPRSKFSSIWTREVALTLALFSLLPLHNNAFNHLFPIFLSTPIATDSHPNPFLFAGGLGLSSKVVGLCLSITGICGIVFKLLTYPEIQARLGNLKTFRLAMCVAPIAYIIVPYLALLPESNLWRWPSIITVVLTQITARGFAIPSTMMLLTDAAPSKDVLGSVHGAGNTVGSLAKAVAPVVGGWIFAWGMENGCVGAVWWGWLCPIAFACLAWSYLLVDFDDKSELE
ncbi:major facilitator superfamily domain-containing protein [Bisporella sp. PMI_857]|nr:major facilitator superfamily domain-containing protein [Bisporella sp. PMI_857]